MNKVKKNLKDKMPFKEQKKQALIFLSILIIMMIICVTCAFKTSKDILIYVDSNDSGSVKPETMLTVNASLMSKVSDVLDQAGIELTDDDYIDTDLDALVKDVDEIHITKKIEGTIKVDGETISFKSSGDTVEDVLRENHITLDSDDEVNPEKDTLLTTETNLIQVIRVDVVMEGREQEVAYGTEKQENAELTTDTQNILTEGSTGIDALVENVIYKDGVEFSREVIFQARILEPVNEVVEVGTQLPGGGTISTGNTTIDPGEEMDFICAVVAQEGGHSYEGALAVISCMMNRADRSGSDVVSVITAPGQFSAYLDGDYLKYMGDELPEVRQAVNDCMVNGIRSHDCYSFRGYYVDGAIQIGGNYYF